MVLDLQRPTIPPLLGGEMALHHRSFFLFFSFPFLLTLLPALGQASLQQDLRLLLSFKSSADALNASLNSWEGPNPCSDSWVGVRCRGGRVVGVVLDGASLVGDVSWLLRLRRLQVLSLRRNALAGCVPRLTTHTSPWLRHLFLSHNQFNGTLAISLPTLVSLRLEGNGFSGGLRGLRLPSVEDFNVSRNLLSGEIPGYLSNFSESAFGGNPLLCGSPLPRCLTTSQMLISQASPSPTPVMAGPCTRKALSKLRVAFILAVGVGDVVVISGVLAIVAGMYMWVTRKRHATTLQAANSTCRAMETDPELLWLEESKKGNGTGLVSFEGGEDLRLDCLLKASAEVLGKGDAGGTYKAALDDGLVVAVKRLDVACFPAGKAFDQHVRAIGRVRHSNVVSLRAYYNAHEEKLLVYDYMPNGSLQSLLQNNRSGHAVAGPLDWKSTKKMLLGVAQGLDFIHSFPSRSPLVHANVKPSNILIDEGGNACVSEWGVMHLARDVRRRPSPPQRLSLIESPTATVVDGVAATGWHRYRAPEVLAGKKATQASDVYSFGMVLLEVVTGKEIGDAEAEEEVMGMVKVGMMCTTEDPEDRPAMNTVVRMISEML